MSLRFDITLSEQEAFQLNALQLAYLGDSVWELIVRYELLIQQLNVRHMHQKCVNLVNAHAQATLLLSFQDILSESEAEIVRRGRNSHPKHAVPKNQSPEEYAAATGFEALFGYLYLTGNNQRIKEICSKINEVKNNV